MFHDQEMKSFAAKLKKVSPVDCGFKIGDKVTYTNSYGVSFKGHTVIGFAENDEFYGKFIYIDTDCYWSSVKPSSLKHE